jgi:hypothetical protein
VLLHVQRQQLALLEDLVAVEARVNDAVKVDEAVQSQLLLHLEAGRAFRARKGLRVGRAILVDQLLVVVAGRRVGKEPRADWKKMKILNFFWNFFMKFLMVFIAYTCTDAPAGPHERPRCGSRAGACT